MLLTVKEMEMLCVCYTGKVSETIEMLRDAEKQPPERTAVINSLIKKLSGLENGGTVSLAFEPEE